MGGMSAFENHEGDTGNGPRYVPRDVVSGAPRMLETILNMSHSQYSLSLHIFNHT